MNTQALLSALAGICFGLYPIVLNRAKLDPMLTIVLYLLGTLILVSPVAFFAQWSTLTVTQLRIGALACVFGAIATFCFNRMLATTPGEDVANMFLVMLVCQVAVPAALLLRNGASARQIAGLGAAAAAIVLLTKK
jgi:drug/metabolite transporter (DMT)-like permease